MRRLALNATGIKSWLCVRALETFLPHLEELYLADNDLWDFPVIRPDEDYSVSAGASQEPNPLSALDLANRVYYEYITGFTHLIVLDLSSCRIDDWMKVMAAGKLPSLLQLLADDNPIEAVSARCTDCFAKLRRLSLSSTL